MYKLTEKDIDYIINDIDKRGIKLEYLRQSLLDHICTIIEINFDEKGDFERYYHEAIKTFYTKELYEIEEETILLATFNNYYIMKKVMIISGVISALAFIGGSLLKALFLPGAATLLFLGIILVSIVFLPLLFILKTKEVKATQDRVILALAVLLGILYCFSMLSWMAHWPAKHIIWLSTLAISFFIFIPLFFFNGIRRPETRINTIVSTILLVAITGIQFTLTALKPERNKENISLVKPLNRDKPEMK